MLIRRKLAPQSTTVAVISNKNAGKGTARAGLGQVIGSILATPQHHYDTATLGQLSAAAAEIMDDRPGVLAIVGGDGTIHQTLTRIMREHEKEPERPLPQFLIVPTGTMNNVATSLKLTRMPATDLAELIKAKVHDRRGEPQFSVKTLNPLRINDEYGFLYGAALPFNFLREYYKERRYVCEGPSGCGYACPSAEAKGSGEKCPKCGKQMGEGALGAPRAIKVILSALLDEFLALLPFRKRRLALMDPVYAKVTLPEGNDPPVAPFMKHTGILIASVDQVGMGCRGMPDAMLRQGHFMLRSSNISFWRLALPTSLGALWGGFPIPSTFDAVVDRLTIEYERPTRVTIDGEMKAARERDVITSGPPLKFITG